MSRTQIFSNATLRHDTVSYINVRSEADRNPAWSITKRKENKETKQKQKTAEQNSFQ